MPRWFLSTRAQSVGGPVAPVKIVDADRPGFPYDLTSELIAAVRGREAYFCVHGFEVNEADGIAHLTYWFDNLQIDNAVPIGILWPGDCIIPIGIDYIFEGGEAIQSGDLIADFLNANFIGAASLSFAAHSLGARVVLQTIDGLARRVRRALFMAGAIDNNCLTDEYNLAAEKIDQISILSSTEDDVLALAFPLGNPLQGIIDRSSVLPRRARTRRPRAAVSACPRPATELADPCQPRLRTPRLPSQRATDGGISATRRYSARPRPSPTWRNASSACWLRTVEARLVRGLRRHSLQIRTFA